jgi:hypothetical protein
VEAMNAKLEVSLTDKEKKDKYDSCYVKCVDEETRDSIAERQEVII